MAAGIHVAPDSGPGALPGTRAPASSAHTPRDAEREQDDGEPAAERRARNARPHARPERAVRAGDAVRQRQQQQHAVEHPPCRSGPASGHERRVGRKRRALIVHDEEVAERKGHHREPAHAQVVPRGGLDAAGRPASDRRYLSAAA